MKRKSKNQYSFRGSRLITMVSVALVLAVLGIVALTGLTARGVTESVRGNIGFVVMVDDTAPKESADSLDKVLRAAPYVAELTYSTPAQVYERWKEMSGGEGADVFDVNPFMPEYDVKVRQPWADADSLGAIAGELSEMTGVFDVKLHADMVGSINRTLNSMMLILLVLAGALTLVSVVLINNTVRLEVYSRRHMIHTMKYVGATPGFIRRPYILAGLLTGIAGAAVASVCVVGLLCYINTVNPAVMQAVTVAGVVWVIVGLFVVGGLLCAAASWFSTSRYLRKNCDEIFS